MENPIVEDDYEAIKKEAKESYDKIGRVWCPALNDYVVFKKPGFRHLVWKGAIQRPKSEQKRRLVLLPHSIEILQNPNAKMSDKNDPTARFWAFTEEREGKMIRVIIRQVGAREKHFFSIFEEK